MLTYPTTDPLLIQHLPLVVSFNMCLLQDVVVFLPSQDRLQSSIPTGSLTKALRKLLKLESIVKEVKTSKNPT